MYVEDLEDHLNVWQTLKRIYAVKDITFPTLYLDHLISCRLEICKDINEYISKIK